MKYKWLLFDADGTLFDYDEAEQAALKKSFKDAGIECSDICHRRYHEINLGLFKELEKGLITSSELRIKRFRVLFSEFQIDLEAKTFSEKYLRYLSQSAELITGALEVIQSLFAKHKLLLVTNGIASVQRSRFERSQFNGFFTGSIISEEVGAAKPAKAFFDAAFKAMGAPDKKDVLIIGDSLTSDMAGGTGYGIDTCWYNPESKTNDLNLDVTYEICELRELLEIVAG